MIYNNRQKKVNLNGGIAKLLRDDFGRGSNQNLILLLTVCAAFSVLIVLSLLRFE